MDWEQILQEAGLTPLEVVVDEPMRQLLAYYPTRAKAEEARKLLASRGLTYPEVFESFDPGLWIAAGEY